MAGYRAELLRIVTHINTGFRILVECTHEHGLTVYALARCIM
jgi:hypothetical protein